MLIVGLTGSIGMGKSTAAGRMRDLGLPVFDADNVVHTLYEGEAAASIEEAFANTTLAGRVDRVALSRALLEDPSGFEKLEAIVHPMVRERQRAFLVQNANLGADIAVVEIPLLFESLGDARVDVTIVVSAPYEVQRDRVLERPGMTQEKFDQILSRQISDSEKRRRADFVVDSSKAKSHAFAQVDAIVEALRIRKGTAFDLFWR
ncbi:MAG: dephospho-CoA kinase [Hyphomicrobiaceae bacterium]